MAFVDAPLIAGLLGKSVSGLALTQTAVMTLEVAAGEVETFQDGVTHTLGSAVSEVFTADSTFPTNVRMALIDNGANVDVWIDTYVDDGFNVGAPVPTGYVVVADIAWFQIAANEVDLLNGTVSRRTWING